MTENELKRTVLARAKARGWLVYHVPQATMRNGGGKGYPDLTLARQGRVLFLELKQETGKLFVEQAKWGAHLPEGTWHVIRPADIHDGHLERLLQ